MSKALEAPQPLYRLDLELEGLPHLQSGSWGHWTLRRKHDAQWKQLVGWHAKRLGLPRAPLQYAHIDCYRFTSREPDFDNLVASFKPLIDGLIGLVIENDSPTCLTRHYRWNRCSVASMGHRVRMIVTERQP